MAQRLKTDWILFFTIVAMVCFGLGGVLMGRLADQGRWSYLVPAALALMVICLASRWAPKGCRCCARSRPGLGADPWNGASSTR